MTNNTMPPLNKLRPASEFSDLLGGVNRSTIHRWITIGVKPGMIRLEAWMLKEWSTTEDCVNRFIEQRTAAKLANAAKSIPTPHARKLRNDRAKAALKKAGFKTTGKKH